jgi:hypothetical protein
MYGQLNLNNQTPEFLEIVMKPQNVIYIKLPDGRALEAILPNQMSTQKHTLEIYSEAKEKNSPTKMALKSITLKKIASKKSHLSSYLQNRKKRVILFDGNLDDRWLPYSANGGVFSKDAYFQYGRLYVNISKDNKWGEVGIVSPKPLIWLDRLEEDGEVKTTFSFDQIKTTGFSIIVGDINKHWKTPWVTFMNLTWTKIEDKNISKLKFSVKNRLLLDENCTQNAPSNITISFKKGKISIEGDTFEKKIFKCPYIVDSRALHFWVFSHAYQKNSPIKMGLKRVILNRTFGKPMNSIKVEKNVKLLPVKEIYGSNTKNRWECYPNISKEKENNCTLSTTSNLIINIPKNSKSKFGIKSKEKIIDLNKRRIEKTPLKMSIYFNPKKTDNFDISLGNNHLFLEKKSDQTYIFKWGKNWSRSINAKWIEDEWNGKINIIMAKNWTKVELDKGVGIYVSEGVSRKFSIYILAKPLKTEIKNGAKLELKKITIEWITPENMSEIDRWELIDDEDFNPDTFLKEIMGEKQ